MLVRCFNCNNLVAHESVTVEEVFEESFASHDGNKAGIPQEFCPACAEEINLRSKRKNKTTYTFTFGGEQNSTGSTSA